MSIERPIFISSIHREKSGVSSCQDFEIKFSSPLYLDNNFSYELAVDQLTMTYSWYNIRSDYNNNKIKYSPDAGVNWFNIEFVNGLYSYDDINEYIHASLKKNNHFKETDGIEEYDINFYFILSTYKISLILTNNYQIDIRNSEFGNLIGFESGIYLKTTTSTKLPNITRFIDDISINCNLIHDSIANGEQTSALINFTTNDLKRGYPFTLKYFNRLYNTIDTNIINHMKFTVVDSLSRIIDLNGIDWNMTLILKKTKIM